MSTATAAKAALASSKSRAQREAEEYLSRIKLKEIFQVGERLLSFISLWQAIDNIVLYYLWTSSACDHLCTIELDHTSLSLSSGFTDTCSCTSARGSHWLLLRGDWQNKERNGRVKREPLPLAMQDYHTLPNIPENLVSPIGPNNLNVDCFRYQACV